MFLACPSQPSPAQARPRVVYQKRRILLHPPPAVGFRNEGPHRFVIGRPRLQASSRAARARMQSSRATGLFPSVPLLHHSANFLATFGRAARRGGWGSAPQEAPPEGQPWGLREREEGAPMTGAPRAKRSPSDFILESMPARHGTHCRGGVNGKGCHCLGDETVTGEHCPGG